jgi:Domain of unknown function (DUF4337)
MASLTETVMKMFTKEAKDPNAPKPVPGSRAEREAKIKDKAGMVINLFALFLAATAWYGGKLSSTVLNDTIRANDVYSFYQAKSIKSTLVEYEMDEAIARGDTTKAEKLKAKIDRYESDPATGEGKKELLEKAKKLEAERDDAKTRGPWIGIAGTVFQLAIVILSASILAVSMELFWGSFIAAAIGLLLASQGLFLWF